MKRHWGTDELVEYWTLLPHETELLTNKTGATRLGFAVLLKFFQLEAYFPQQVSSVPTVVVEFIAKQVKVAPEHFEQYQWRGRTIEYHRAQIRKLHGFRETTVDDAQALSHWLCEQVLQRERNVERLKSAVYDRCRELHLEPPTTERIDRVVRSAVRTYEESFCAEILARLSSDNQASLDALLQPAPDEEDCQREAKSEMPRALWHTLRADPGRTSLDTMLDEIAKLEHLRTLELPPELFAGVPRRVLHVYRQRAVVEEPYELRRHPASLRLTLLAAFAVLRMQEITDTLVDLLLEIVHRLELKAERKADKELLQDLKRVTGKNNLLFQLALAALQHPEGIVKDVVYPIVPEQTLQDLVKEWRASGPAYQQKLTLTMRNSYRSHYRRMLPRLLQTLEFRSNNDTHRPVIAALDLLRRHADSKMRVYPLEEEVPFEGVVKNLWRGEIHESDAVGNIRVSRITYEICVLQTLREKLRCKEIWVVGADRYRNPDDDLPADFEPLRGTYYEALRLPRDAESFIARLKQEMRAALSTLDQGLPNNPQVKILPKDNGWISLSPLEAQPEPQSLTMLKAALGTQWPMTSLLDMLKETDFRVGFTNTFKSPTAWETMEREVLQPRLLLCLYGLGTNAGLKRMNAEEHGASYKDLLYVRRRFITKDHMREAIRRVVNAVFRVRNPHIWGEGTTACASDSKKFGAWDQNLMTEWHVRYGGRGVMIYWHVEHKSTCIYSQLKNCSSSEVAAMIEGVLRHCTEIIVNKQYVDSHGQSEVAFAFCHLLGFELLPRLKAIHAQKLYRVEAGQPEEYPNLQRVLTRAIDWATIRQQYDQMVKYATALRLGIAETESILRRFTRSNLQHPTYKALAELGKAMKTIFLCRYLHSLELRRDINEGLNVVENWNSANNFILYGKGGEFATNRREDQEITMLSLHLLQLCLVYINTLMIQQVLHKPQWQARMHSEDLRALTPLIYSHVTPYGTFRLDMNERLVIEAAIAA